MTKKASSLHGIEYAFNYDTLAADLLTWKQYNLLPKYFIAPLYVLWEITYRCPLNCIHCYNNSPRKVYELNTQEMMNLANEMIENRIFGICLSGGEPLSREDIYLNLMKQFAEAGISVGTITNGWYINEKNAKAIARYARSVQVSLDGSCPEVHDRIRRRSGSFKRAIEAVELLKKYDVVSLDVAFVPTSYNIEDFPNMIELCLDLGVNSLRTQPLGMTGKALNDAAIEPSDEDYANLVIFIDKISKKLRKRLRIEWGDPFSHIKMGKLLGLTIGVRITADGFFGFTPYLNYFMGNVGECSFQEAWRRGLCLAWSHPQVKKELAAIQSFSEIKHLNAAREHVYLNPDEAFMQKGALSHA